MGGKNLKSLVHVAIILAFIVIALGASTRLTNSGLGCPDWPMCYGQITPSATTPSVFKAWMEMLHRYAAGILSVLILWIVFTLSRHALSRQNKAQMLLAIFLLLLLIYQPILGMLTVTLKLAPIIVSQHLIGGMFIFVLLCLIRVSLIEEIELILFPQSIGLLLRVALLALILQICLGAWTSTNYAAISCDSFPFCTLSPWHLDLSHAFSLKQSFTINYDGGILSLDARRSIQMVHRLGALIVVVLWGILSVMLLTKTTEKSILYLAFSVLLLLFFQVILGILNVLLERPLFVSVLHSLTATVLLVVCSVLTFQVKPLKRELSYGYKHA